jgi:hypothetical protein
MNMRFHRRLPSNPFAKPASVPKTDAEWQVVADVANMMLTIELARTFGLVDATGKADVELCAKRLADARSRGILPRNLGPGLSP